MAIGNTAPSRDVRLTKDQGPRYFDGRVRTVVKVLRDDRSGSGSEQTRVELLDCGHTKVCTKPLTASNSFSRVCFECPGMP